MTSSMIDTLNGIIGAGTPVVSVAPVELFAPDRPVPLEVRVSAPAAGTNLPRCGVLPRQRLEPRWILATHGILGIPRIRGDPADTSGLAPERFRVRPPGFPTIWTERIADLTRILDQLDTIEFAVPGLAGRIDRSRVAATGHSWGGQTAQSLLGARIFDEAGQVGQDMSDSRVTAGILFAATGLGGENLHPFAQANFPFMRPSFQELTTPTLVVAGDHDQSKMSSRGPDWFTDAYTHSPGATDLLSFYGAEHALGGIVGYEVAETTDENPERVAAIQRMSTAYLRTALRIDETSWPAARAAFSDNADPIGRVDTK